MKAAHPQTALVNTSGSVVDRYTYDPYGRMSFRNANWTGYSSVGSIYGFKHGHQGGRYSVNTGLYHFRNRDYSPTLGRWVQQEPGGYVDGTNLYLYLRANPTVLVDYTGWQSTQPSTNPEYPRKPTDDEASGIMKGFPNLTREEITILGPDDRRYNCHAHVLGVKDQPVHAGVLPPRARGKMPPVFPQSVEQFEQIFAFYGYKPSANCDEECGKKKIAIYTQQDKFGNERVTHSAIQCDSGGWESKMGGESGFGIAGGNFLIGHPNLSDLEGGQYGGVFKCYEKAVSAAATKPTTQDASKP